jgi:hypothetical protein
MQTTATCYSYTRTTRQDVKTCKQEKIQYVAKASNLANLQSWWKASDSGSEEEIISFKAF